MGAAWDTDVLRKGSGLRSKGGEVPLAALKCKNALAWTYPLHRGRC